MNKQKINSANEQIGLEGLTREIICDLVEIYNKNKVPESHSKCYAGSGIRVDASSLKKIVASFGVYFTDEEVTRAIISFSRGDALTFSDFIKFYLWYVPVFKKIMSKTSAALETYSDNWKKDIKALIKETKMLDQDIPGFLLFDFGRYAEKEISPSEFTIAMMKEFNKLPQPRNFSRKANIKPYLSFDITLWSIFGLIPYEYIGIENDLPSLDVFIQIELCNQTFKSSVFPARYSPSISQTFSFDFNFPSEMSFLDASWWIQNAKLKISVYAVHYLDNFVSYHLLGQADQPLIPLLIDQHGRTTCAINLQALSPTYPIPVLVSITNKCKESDDKSKPENSLNAVNPLIYHSAPIEQLIFENFINQIRDNLLIKNKISPQSFIRYCNYYKEITVRFPAREYQILGFDEVNVAHFINTFLYSQQLQIKGFNTGKDDDQLLREKCRLLMYIVSLKGYTVFDRPEPEVIQIRNLITTKTCKLDPNLMERALLLCNLLTSIGVEAYVCIGDYQFQRYVWVMTGKTDSINYENITDFMMVDCGNKAYTVSSFINHKYEFPTPTAVDRIDGQQQIIFSHGINPLLLGINSIPTRPEKDEYVPNKKDDTRNPRSNMCHWSVTGIWPDRVPCGLKVATVFNSKQIYCNIQNHDDVEVVKWDLNNTSKWAPLYSKPCDNFESVYPARFLQRLLKKPKFVFTDEEKSNISKLLFIKKFNMFKKSVKQNCFDKFTNDAFHFDLLVEETFELENMYQDKEFLNNYNKTHLLSLLETQLLLNLTPIERQILNAYLICKGKIQKKSDYEIKQKRFNILLKSQENEDRQKINNLIQKINLSILKLNSSGNCKFIELDSILRYFLSLAAINNKPLELDLFKKLKNKGVLKENDKKIYQQFILNFQLDYLHIINYIDDDYILKNFAPIFNSFLFQIRGMLRDMSQLSQSIINGFEEEDKYVDLFRKMRKVDPDFERILLKDEEKKVKDVVKSYLREKERKRHFSMMEIFLQYCENLADNVSKENITIKPEEELSISNDQIPEKNLNDINYKLIIINAFLKRQDELYKLELMKLNKSSDYDPEFQLYVPETIYKKELLTIIREENENIFEYYSIDKFMNTKFPAWNKDNDGQDQFEVESMQENILFEKLEMLALIEMILEILYKLMYNRNTAFIKLTEKETKQVKTIEYKQYIDNIIKKMIESMKNKSIFEIFNDYKYIIEPDKCDKFNCGLRKSNYERIINESIENQSERIKEFIKYKIALIIKKTLFLIKRRPNYSLPYPAEWFIRCNSKMIIEMTKELIFQIIDDKKRKPHKFDPIDFIEKSVEKRKQDIDKLLINGRKVFFSHLISLIRNILGNQYALDIDRLFNLLTNSKEKIEFEIFKNDIVLFLAYSNCLNKMKKKIKNLKDEDFNLDEIYNSFDELIPLIDNSIDEFKNEILEQITSEQKFESFIDEKEIKNSKKLIKKRIESFRLTKELINKCSNKNGKASLYKIPKEIIIKPPKLIDNYPNSISNLFMNCRSINNHIRNKPFFFLFYNNDSYRISESQHLRQQRIQRRQMNLQQNQQKEEVLNQQNLNLQQQKLRDNEEMQKIKNNTLNSMLSLKNQLMAQKQNRLKRIEQITSFNQDIDKFIKSVNTKLDKYEKYLCDSVKIFKDEKEGKLELKKQEFAKDENEFSKIDSYINNNEISKEIIENLKSVNERYKMIREKMESAGTTKGPKSTKPLNKTKTANVISIPLIIYDEDHSKDPPKNGLPSKPLHFPSHKKLKPKQQILQDKEDEIGEQEKEKKKNYIQLMLSRSSPIKTTTDLLHFSSISNNNNNNNDDDDDDGDGDGDDDDGDDDDGDEPIKQQKSSTISIVPIQNKTNKVFDKRRNSVVPTKFNNKPIVNDKDDDDEHKTKPRRLNKDQIHLSSNNIQKPRSRSVNNLSNSGLNRVFKVPDDVLFISFKEIILEKRKKSLLRPRWELRKKVKRLLNSIRLSDESRVPFVSFDSKSDRYIEYIEFAKTKPNLTFNENQKKDLNNLLNLDVAMSTSSSLLIFHNKWSEERLIKQIQSKLISFERDIIESGRYSIDELHEIVKKSIRSHRYMLRVSKHKIDDPLHLADQLSLSGALTSSCGAEKCIIVAQPFRYLLDARSTWVVMLFIYKVPDNLSFSKKNDTG